MNSFIKLKKVKETLTLDFVLANIFAKYVCKLRMA